MFDKRARVIYGVFDAEGAPKGFYPTDVYPPDRPMPKAPDLQEGEEPPPPDKLPEPQPDSDFPRNAKIPTEAILITEEQWMALLRNPWARYEGGEVVQYDPPPIPEPQAPPWIEQMERLEARIRELEGKR